MDIDSTALFTNVLGNFIFALLVYVFHSKLNKYL